MGRYTWTFLLVLMAAAIGTGVLFTIQNSARETQLSLDLGFTAMQLAEPVSIPALIGVCFGSGFLVGAVVMVVRSTRQGSRIRKLEQELAVSSAVGGTQDDAWR